MNHGLRGIKSMLAVLCVAAILAMSGTLHAQAWMDPGWDYRMPIEVDNSSNPDALTNYQLKNIYQFAISSALIIKFEISGDS